MMNNVSKKPWVDESRGEWILLGVIFVVAVIFRWWYTSDAKFQFHYEQARDAIVSRKIYSQFDLKIMGPPAGNSDEKLYHGVLYYYVIGLFYFLFRGDPIKTTLSLGIVASTAVIPIYLLARGLANDKKTGLMAALLYAVCLTAAEMGSHLFNISLATVTIPWLFYFAWLVLVKNKTKLLPWLALFLGLTAQMGIYLIYLIVPVGILWMLRWRKNKKWVIGSKPNMLGSAVVLAGCLSTMILAQYKLWRAGVFSWRDIVGANSSILNWWQRVAEALNLYVQRLMEMYVTPVGWLTFVVLAMIGYQTMKDLNKRDGNVIKLWLMAPLLLLLVLPRKTNYMTVGLPAAVIILLAIWITKQWLRPKMRTVGMVVLGVFLISNIWTAIGQRSAEVNSLYAGAYLKDELAVVDKAYGWAGGQPFSISTLTSPYGVATTWEYLFDWYGKTRYGYVPHWFGPDQTALVGADLMEPVDTSDQIQVAIYEGYFNQSDKLFQSFKQLQDVYSPVLMEEYGVGGLKAELRGKLNGK